MPQDSPLTIGGSHPFIPRIGSPNYTPPQRLWYLQPNPDRNLQDRDCPPRHKAARQRQPPEGGCSQISYFISFHLSLFYFGLLSFFHDLSGYFNIIICCALNNSIDPQTKEDRLNQLIDRLSLYPVDNCAIDSFISFTVIPRITHTIDFFSLLSKIYPVEVETSTTDVRAAAFGGHGRERPAPVSPRSPCDVPLLARRTTAAVEHPSQSSRRVAPAFAHFPLNSSRPNPGPADCKFFFPTQLTSRATHSDSLPASLRLVRLSDVSLSARLTTTPEQAAPFPSSSIAPASAWLRPILPRTSNRPSSRLAAPRVVPIRPSFTERLFSSRLLTRRSLERGFASRKRTLAFAG